MRIQSINKIFEKNGQHHDHFHNIDTNKKIKNIFEKRTQTN